MVDRVRSRACMHDASMCARGSTYSSHNILDLTRVAVVAPTTRIAVSRTRCPAPYTARSSTLGIDFYLLKTLPRIRCMHRDSTCIHALIYGCLSDQRLSRAPTDACCACTICETRDVVGYPFYMCSLDFVERARV